MSTAWSRLFALFTLILSPAVFAQVVYEIEITEPEHHLAEVTVEIPAGHQAINLKLPTWRTGKYQIINQANGIRNFSVKGPKGRSLNWQRIDKSHWRADNPSKKKISVTYQVYANELGSRSRHIDSTHGYLDATAVFMYAEEVMGSKHKVSLNVPKEWRSFSGMEQKGKHSFLADNYHQLASSPIETGINKLKEFSVDGRDYQLVIWGEGNYKVDKMAKDLKALVNQGSTIWSDYPYKKYVFIVHATSGATGATEHINSTVIQRPRFFFAPQADYLKYFLRTAAHELVHTWNVKAYRPAPLVPYDYQAENYSRLLWVAEGSTSYFQDHLLLTAGLEKVSEYLTVLSERIDGFKHRPGSKVQSVSDASFEKWIAQGKDFANNHSVNIYSEGFMASWLLDFQMLQDTDLESGYKDLHDRLYAMVKLSPDVYRQYRAVPFDETTMLTLAKDITGKDYKAWWQDNVESPLNIDFETMLEKVGLEFVALKDKDYKPWLGLKSIDKKGFATLEQVEQGGPAWQAGMTIGDQLVAINGVKVTQATIEKLLQGVKAGDDVRVTLFRNDNLIDVELTLDKIAKKVPKIAPVKSPTEKQKAFFKAWLGVDFPKAEKKD